MLVTRMLMTTTAGSGTQICTPLDHASLRSPEAIVAVLLLPFESSVTVVVWKLKLLGRPRDFWAVGIHSPWFCSRSAWGDGADDASGNEGDGTYDLDRGSIEEALVEEDREVRVRKNMTFSRILPLKPSTTTVEPFMTLMVLLSANQIRCSLFHSLHPMFWDGAKS